MLFTAINVVFSNGCSCNTIAVTWELSLPSAVPVLWGNLLHKMIRLKKNKKPASSLAVLQGSAACEANLGNEKIQNKTKP